MCLRYFVFDSGVRARASALGLSVTTIDGSMVTTYVNTLSVCGPYNTTTLSLLRVRHCAAGGTPRTGVTFTTGHAARGGGRILAGLGTLIPIHLRQRSQSTCHDTAHGTTAATRLAWTDDGECGAMVTGKQSTVRIIGRNTEHQTGTPPALRPAKAHLCECPGIAMSMVTSVLVGFL